MQRLTKNNLAHVVAPDLLSWLYALPLAPGQGAVEALLSDSIHVYGKAGYLSNHWRKMHLSKH